jgi:hypothetical protein
LKVPPLQESKQTVKSKKEMLTRTWCHDARPEGRIRMLSLYTAMKKDPLMKNKSQRLGLRVAWQKEKEKESSRAQEHA